LQIGQRQVQAPVLTPALQQALKLLQISSIELEAVVREALETNPLLVADEAPADLVPALPPPVPRRATAGYRPSPQAMRLFGAAARQSADRAGGNTGNDPGTFDLAGQEGSTLQEALLEDIAFAFDDPVDRQITLDLASLLDDAGYLAGDLADVAEYRKVSTTHVENVLARLKGVVPAGLFARDLADCLRLQLIDQEALDPAMAQVLDHLDLLAENGPAALAVAAGLEADIVSRCLARLRQLNPRPGASLAHQAAPTIVPDIIVLPKRADSSPDSEFVQSVGRWTVALNPALVPNLSLDRAGLQDLRARARRAEDRDYLKTTAQDATWLIRAIEQRTTTLLRMAVEIFRRQESFLESGPAGLKPLTQKEIARVTEIHESTVSRAVNQKYAATPQGVVPLKFLFCNPVRDLSGGRDHAAKVVRHRLKALIGAESAPVSDGELTRLLRLEGYDVARRTVAKYRGLLRIPSSIERRRAGPARASAGRNS